MAWRRENRSVDRDWDRNDRDRVRNYAREGDRDWHRDQAREDEQRLYDRGYDRVYASREADRWRDYERGWSTRRPEERAGYDRDYDRGWHGRAPHPGRPEDRHLGREDARREYRPQYPPAYDRGDRIAESERGYHPRDFQRGSTWERDREPPPDDRRQRYDNQYGQEYGRWRYGGEEDRGRPSERDRRGYDAQRERYEGGPRGYEDERRYAGGGGTYGAGYGGAYGGPYGGSITGRYAGVGPRGYRRSDERIREEVIESLTIHPDIDASDIDVSVEGGEVTLRGTVDSRWIKRTAEDEAESVFGVTNVRNSLRVAGRETAGTNRESRGVPDRRTLALTEGMAAVASDGEQVGTVKEVRDRDFLLDRPMRRDVYVPFDYIRDVSSDRLTLSVRSGDIDEMNWERPPLAQAA
jgi:hypothetical protein